MRQRLAIISVNILFFAMFTATFLWLSTPQIGSAATCAVPATYASAGVCTATLTVTDDDGVSGQDSIEITVEVPTAVTFAETPTTSKSPFTFVKLLSVVAGILLLRSIIDFLFLRRR